MPSIQPHLFFSTKERFLNNFYFRLPNNESEMISEINRYKDTLTSKDATCYVEKTFALFNYFKKNNIRNVVIGVSGGIDSAFVLSLLMEVSKIYPLNIHACTFTFNQYDGIFDDSYIDVLMKWTTKESAKVHWIVKDLSTVDSALFRALDIIHTEENQANVNYALRYNALFAVAQSVGGVTIGTTNFDEFGYIGWFGKNSDMVVDIQCITDLHKFEVFALSEKLKVPKKIIERVPTGDLINAKTDEECFGVSYDELSYFTAYMMYKCQTGNGIFVPIEHQEYMLNDFMKKKFNKVMKLHSQNRHKYQGQTYNPIFIL